MKKYALSLVTLMLPLMAQAELLDTLKSYEETRLQTALCGMNAQEVAALEGTLIKPARRSKESSMIMNKLKADLRESVSSCTTVIRDVEIGLDQELKLQDPAFPLEIMKPFSTPEAEHKQNELALAYIQSKEGKSCETMKREDLYNSDKFHKLLLTSGWKCVANNFIRLSANLNSEMKYEISQSTFKNLESQNLSQLKELFKRTFKHGVGAHKLKIALVPHLSWESTTLNTILPYKFFVDQTELTSYAFLIREFKKLGVSAVLIERNSLESLESQVEETSKGIAALKEPHLVISRSMGARVMRQILVKNNPKLNDNILALFNVGGTPHGSVIARSKFHPDVFFRGVVPTVVGTLNLPINIIAKDPRVPDFMEATIYSALNRQNLNTMSPIQPRQLKESNVPVLNALMVRNDHVRAMPLVDPVWMHMIQQGPTEGSSQILGSAVDTNNSMRLILDSDHLGFWKYTPNEALAIYLRLILTSAHSGLIKVNTP